MAVDQSAEKPKASSARRRPAWQTDIFKLLATGAIAGFAAILGSYLTYLGTSKDIDLKYHNLNRDLDLKYGSMNREAELKNSTAIKELNIKIIDLTLSILAGEKGGAKERDNEGYILARDFAIKALSKAAEIPVSDADRIAWAKAGPIPLSPVSMNPALVNENAGTDDLVFDDAVANGVTVCIGEHFSGCPSGTKNHYTCGTSLDRVVAAACPKNGGVSTLTLSRGGNRCGYATYDIVCNS
jgi:hypothetical protein